MVSSAQEFRHPRPLDLLTNLAAVRAELQSKLLWLYIKGFQNIAGFFPPSVVAYTKFGSGQTVKYIHDRYVRQLKTRISI